MLSMTGTERLLIAQNSLWATSIVCETTIHDFIVDIQILAVMTD